MAPSMAKYPDLFNNRGDAYHRAMVDQPAARSSEFELAVTKARLSPGHITCDVPSGGGYLSPYLGPSANLVCVDYSRKFVTAAAQAGNISKVLAPVPTIPLKSGCCDRVISIAGLHHFDSAEKNGFFSEAFRVLNDDGLLMLADVDRHSNIATFLDDFVGKHNTTGHRGQYFDENTPESLARCGFEVLENDLESYAWGFPDVERMVDYSRLLFGLKDASRLCIKEGIEQHLGYRESRGGCLMNWQLRYILAGKRP